MKKITKIVLWAVFLGIIALSIVLPGWFSRRSSGERDRADVQRVSPVGSQEEGKREATLPAPLANETPVTASPKKTVKNMFAGLMEKAEGSHDAEADAARNAVLEQIAQETPSALVLDLATGSADTDLFIPQLHEHQKHMSVYEPRAQYEEIIKDPRIHRLLELLETGDGAVIAEIASAAREQVRRLANKEVDFYGVEHASTTPFLPMLLSMADPSLPTLQVLAQLEQSQAVYVDDAGNAVPNQLWLNNPSDAANLLGLAMEQVFDALQETPENLSPEQLQVLDDYQSGVDQRMGEVMAWASRQEAYQPFIEDGTLDNAQLSQLGHLYAHEIFGMEGWHQSILEWRGQLVETMLRILEK